MGSSLECLYFFYKKNYEWKGKKPYSTIIFGKKWAHLSSPNSRLRKVLYKTGLPQVSGYHPFLVLFLFVCLFVCLFVFYKASDSYDFDTRVPLIQKKINNQYPLCDVRFEVRSTQGWSGV